MDLVTFNIPHLDLVLDEIFLVPGATVQTTGALAELCSMSEAEVVAKLGAVVALAGSGVETAQLDPASAEHVWVDVDATPLAAGSESSRLERLASLPGWSQAHTVRIHALGWSVVRERLQAIPRATVIASTPRQAWSAAMWLRSKGLTHVWAYCPRS